MLGSVCNSCSPCKTKTMTQGTDDQISITLFKAFPSEVYDLSDAGVTEIEAAFPALDPSAPVIKKLSLSQITKVGTGTGGQIVVPFSQADLDLMIAFDEAGGDVDKQSFVVFVTDTGKKKAARFDSALIILTNPVAGS